MQSLKANNSNLSLSLTQLEIVDEEYGDSDYLPVYKDAVDENDDDVQIYLDSAVQS